MKAGFLAAVRKFDTREVPAPVAGAGEALIKVKCCAFCGSDLHDAASGWAAPRIPGHEFAGVVETIDDPSKRFKVGDRVVINPVMSCGKCDRCLSGNNHLCDKFAVIGCQTPGGFAQYVKVPVSSLRHLPNGLSFKAASLSDPLAVAVHAGELCGDVKGKRCFVFGAGPIGLFMLQVLRIKGAGELVISDLYASHLAVAKKVAPEVTTLNAKDDPNYDSINGRRFDIGIELAGGKAPTLAKALQLTVRGGLVVQIAQRPPTEIDCGALVFGEKRIQGVFGQRSENFDQALAMLGNGAIDGEALITDTFDLDHMMEAYQRLLEADSIKVVVVP